MKIIVKKNPEEMSMEAFALFKAGLRDSDVLGFATGGTPLGLYGLISAECRSGGISFRGKKSFNLDEYYPISASDRNSYRYFMEQNLFSNIDIPRANISFPNAQLSEEDAVLEYRRAYARNGPVDLQILGIGVNGHIGFNEPGSEIDSQIRIVNLLRETILRNHAGVSRAITMGMKEILQSRSILLIASGIEKSSAVRMAVKGKPGKSVPASFLQTHADTTLILDSAAASKLG